MNDLILLLVAGLMVVKEILAAAGDWVFLKEHYWWIFFVCVVFVWVCVSRLKPPHDTNHWYREREKPSS